MADVAPVLPEFSIGDRMRKAREAAGIKSTDRMAELLNAHLKPAKPISTSTVSAWERGANQPRRMSDVVDAYASICTTEGKGRVRVTRAWLYGIESRATSSEKRERAADLGLSVVDGPKKLLKSASNRTPMMTLATT